MTRKEFMSMSVEDLLKLANSYNVDSDFDSDFVSYCKDVEISMCMFRTLLSFKDKESFEGYLR